MWCANVKCSLILKYQQTYLTKYYKSYIICLSSAINAKEFANSNKLIYPHIPHFSLILSWQVVPITQKYRYQEKVILSLLPTYYVNGSLCYGEIRYKFFCLHIKQFFAIIHNHHHTPSSSSLLWLSMHCARTNDNHDCMAGIHAYTPWNLWGVFFLLSIVYKNPPPGLFLCWRTIYCIGMWMKCSIPPKETCNAIITRIYKLLSIYFYIATYNHT